MDAVARDQVVLRDAIGRRARDHQVRDADRAPDLGVEELPAGAADERDEILMAAGGRVSRHVHAAHDPVVGALERERPLDHDALAVEALEVDRGGRGALPGAPSDGLHVGAPAHDDRVAGDRSAHGPFDRPPRAVDGIGRCRPAVRGEVVAGRRYVQRATGGGPCGGRGHGARDEDGKDGKGQPEALERGHGRTVFDRAGSAKQTMVRCLSAIPPSALVERLDRAGRRKGSSAAGPGQAACRPCTVRSIVE